MVSFARVRRAVGTYPAQVVLLALTYWGSAELGIRLAAANQLVTAVWPPTGISVIALVIGGRRLWPGIAAGAFVAEMMSGVPMHFAAGMAVGNTLAPVLAHAALERVRIRDALVHVRDVLVFVAIACASMVVSATGGTAMFTMSHGTGGRAVWLTWLIWWVGDAMGVVLIAPLGLALARGGHRRFVRPGETIAFLLAMAALTAGLWQSPLSIRHLVIPVAILAALRLGPRGAALMAFVAAGSAIATAALTPRPDDFLLLQTLNASVALTSLVLAAVMHERNQKDATLRAVAVELEHRIDVRTADLARLNAELEQAQTLSHLGSFHWDTVTDVARWSDELFRIHDLDPEDGPLTMDQYMDMVHAGDRDRVRSNISDAIRTGIPAEHEFRFRLPSGEERWMHAFIAPTYTQDGELAGLHGATQDVTRRRQAEEAHNASELRFKRQRHRVEKALREALDREREATTHLRKLDETKNSILSAVSHELRTPLTAILGFTELLKDADVRSDETMSEEVLDRLEGSARRLGRLLQDLLDLSRLDHGMLEPRRETQELRHLIRESLLDIDTGDHPLLVEETAGSCTVDPTHFERIVQNLVGNAVKHTPPGTPIHVGAHLDDAGGVTIEVDDEGPGIPADKWQTVFEPFEQLASGSYTQGAGVGLALVDRFARMHDGRAWLTEREGGGAAFRVYLSGAPAAVA